MSSQAMLRISEGAAYPSVTKFNVYISYDGLDCVVILKEDLVSLLTTPQWGPHRSLSLYKKGLTPMLWVLRWKCAFKHFNVYCYFLQPGLVGHEM